MEALIPWVIGILIMAAVIWLGWYAWSANHYRAQKKIDPPPVPVVEGKNNFDTELAEEIAAFPIWEKESPPPAPELPHLYNKDCLVLMARDPYWLYAYWEISTARQEELKNNFGEQFWHHYPPVIRVYDITGVDNFDGTNANLYVDIYINNHCMDWYIEIGSPDRTYCVDLGRMLPNGQFITILRSNAASTPRAWLSDRFDEEWMWIDGIYRMMGKVQYGISTALMYEENIPSSPEFNKPYN
ncbi:hypothetical protein JOC37_001655 [Desulfohalotomaculum tongense]|uniref:DUF4912 domain-containing protein n=1 Tax=Desulforadius tongensis TaxID=1216062 RepID=UPI001EE53979|nr:DUF4912 domain-containing protein [Desulforadius tongensis]MBM7855262.1 hypothetical protein [Desulforadius tongensis]